MRALRRGLWVPEEDDVTLRRSRDTSPARSLATQLEPDPTTRVSHCPASTAAHCRFAASQP